MNCKNCRHWFVNPNIVIPGEPTEGKCLVSEIKTQSNQVCNAWERSQIAEWKDDNEKLTARIAELEAERRWKDSNVELPKDDTDGNALIVIHRYSGEWARAPFGAEFSDEFIRHYSHWMNAPEMPEVQE